MTQRIADRMQAISSFYVMELLQRAKQLEQQGRDVIHMEIGEPDFPSTQSVIEAGKRCIDSGEVKYTAPAGLPELRQAIADFYQQRYQVKVSPERIFITPGASGAFLLAFGISLNPEQSIMMADPCYPCNENFARVYGATAQYVSVNAEQAYQLNADLINHHWQANTQGVLIASPSNPTGTVISAEALQQAIATVEQHGGCFYSDEIYHGLDYDQPISTALSFSDKVFVINSFSKYFAMTGWRIGWLVVPENFIQAAEKLAQNIFISTATHSQYAALASFSAENLAELDQRRDTFKQRRDFLYENLLRLGFKIDCKPQGAFYLYADCSAFTNDSFQFAKDLLEAEAVAVTPGIDFGTHQANTRIRFAYTASIDRMTIALNRLERFLCR